MRYSGQAGVANHSAFQRINKIRKGVRKFGLASGHSSFPTLVQFGREGHGVVKLSAVTALMITLSALQKWAVFKFRAFQLAFSVSTCLSVLVPCWCRCNPCKGDEQCSFFQLRNKKKCTFAALSTC